MWQTLAGVAGRARTPSSTPAAGPAVGLVSAVITALLLCGCSQPQVETPAPSLPGPASSNTTPVTGLKGWQVNDTTIGLAAVGLSCDRLPLYTGSEKPDAGATINGQRIETTLDLSNGGIAIERSCIRPQNISPGTPLVSTTDFNKCDSTSCPSPPAPVILRDCEIDGSAAQDQTVAYSLGFGGIGTVERCNIHDVGSGIGLVNTGTQFDALISGNYIHRLRAWGESSGDGSHNDGITVRDFVVGDTDSDRQAVIENNHVDASSGNDTGALFIQPNNGPIDRVTIRGNLLEGNGYQLGMERANGFDYGKDMRALDNRFSGTDFGAAYVDAKGLSYGWSEWSDNYVADPAQPSYRGRPLAPPRL